MNEALRDELLAMQAHDLDTRQQLVDSGELFTTDQSYHPVMKAVHEANNKRIKQILDQYGWPGYTLVGQEGSEAAWLIIQHAVLDPEMQRSALSMMKDAVDKGDSDPIMMAMLHDRVLMLEGKPQVYGTQHVVDPDTDQLIPYQIENPKAVDSLREQVGLEPLAIQTKELNDERNQSLRKKH